MSQDMGKIIQWAVIGGVVIMGVTWWKKPSALGEAATGFMDGIKKFFSPSASGPSNDAKYQADVKAFIEAINAAPLNAEQKAIAIRDLSTVNIPNAPTIYGPINTNTIVAGDRSFAASNNVILPDPVTGNYGQSSPSLITPNTGLIYTGNEKPSIDFGSSKIPLFNPAGMTGQ